MKHLNLLLAFVFLGLSAQANYEVTITSAIIKSAKESFNMNHLGPGDLATITITIKNTGTQSFSMNGNNGSNASFGFTCELTNSLLPATGVVGNDVIQSPNTYFGVTYASASNKYTGTNQRQTYNVGDIITVTINVRLDPNSTSPIGETLQGFKFTITNMKSGGVINGSPATANYILPIKLNTFTGARNSQGNLLKWSVSDAVDFSSFQLQRAASPSSNYVAVANIGYENGISEYSYQDLPGAAYYRLGMLDRDGSIRYSAILFLPENTFKGFESRLYPNPAISNLNIMLYSPGGKNLGLSVLDINGRECKRVQLDTAEGFNYQLDISGLSRGAYILNIIGPAGIIESKKFIKL